MKLAIFLIALVATTSGFAATTNPQTCFTIKNNIDRKYCIDKYLETVKDKMAAEKKTWAKGLKSDVKTARTEAINTEIQAKKDQKSLLDAEIALNEKHLADLSAMKVAAPKKKSKKKEKNKLPFGIKL